MDLGQFIREQRNGARLSLRRLSDMAGISNPYLSQIERGLREPSERVLESMARALEVSADTLYEQAGRSQVGDEDEGEPAIVTAVKKDQRLTARRRKTLLEVYYSFTGRPRPRQGAA